MTTENHPVVAAVMDDPVVKAAIDEVSGPAGEARAVASEAAATLQTAGSREAAAALATRLSDEDTLRTAGQRTINLIWENTQMRLALSVIWGALVVSAALAVFGKWLGNPDLQLAAIVFLFGVANLVTGFYFGRTNHQRVGGVGANDAGR